MQQARDGGSTGKAPFRVAEGALLRKRGAGYEVYSEPVAADQRETGAGRT